ncbi:ANK_REP_REGION domain-containing protein [Haematococcus lacustris]|uniref:ANK_REP_REGION domain-containing protein n=1 Tax=Haematococcus lacustris TaxID=44745 RepID=A0A699YI14_HAELA|nr:ANK_REP_REGION domain-containing protein [Haematococcus lacustris]
MERTPWWSTIDASKLQPWDGKAVGVKPDGGGSIRGQGRVGPMRLHRAAHNRNAEAIKACIASGDDVNEVEAAGNTPLHAAAYEGWDEGVQLLLSLGAKAGASKVQGKVLVQENIPKVSDFYQKECWAHHPLPYADYVEYKRKERDAWEEQRRRNRMIESTS